MAHTGTDISPTVVGEHPGTGADTLRIDPSRGSDIRRGRAALFLYADAGPNIARRDAEEILRMNVDDQAQQLCLLIAGAIPDVVVRRFCELTGADLERLLEVCGDRVLTSPTRTEDDKKASYKLTHEEVKSIRAMKGQMTASEIGSIYNIAPRTVQRIWQRHTYQEVL